MKNLMKKSVVSVVLVLVMFSVASAATGFTSGGASSLDINVADLGNPITVDLTSDVGVASILYMQVIDTSTVGGTAGPATVNAGFDLFAYGGSVVNSGGVLLKDVTGMLGVMNVYAQAFPANPLVTFSYTPPAGLPVGTLWDIAIGTGSVVTKDATGAVTGLNVSPLTLEVVPEPMTIVLLGLGGLFLRRRK